ncbi:DUF397 domain-containing protein [Streptomyces sodiiphilus]|uniref:DUF397 domain-containing protein n=1 Tax=Streptomyces sodiiphilus TaxID=226217 RepID=UPI0031CEEC2D
MRERQDLYAINPNELSRQKGSLTANSGEWSELAPLPGGGVAVRDSKNPDRPHLCFTSAQ